jgi:hypothetical protein
MAKTTKIAPRRSSIIYSGNIDKATCIFEEVVARIARLEEKSKPIFVEQDNFESAIQTRLYRIWDNGNPTKHCIKFVYDTRNKEKTIFGIKYTVSCSLESRTYIDTVVSEKIQESNRQQVI